MTIADAMKVPALEQVMQVLHSLFFLFLFPLFFPKTPRFQGRYPRFPGALEVVLIEEEGTEVIKQAQGGAKHCAAV